MSGARPRQAASEERGAEEGTALTILSIDLGAIADNHDQDRIGIEEGGRGAVGSGKVDGVYARDVGLPFILRQIVSDDCVHATGNGADRLEAARESLDQVVLGIIEFGLGHRTRGGDVADFLNELDNRLLGVRSLHLCRGDEWARASTA